MRRIALKVLEDEMSENTLRHIREIDYLEDWIVDAMINFHESEVKKLNLLDDSNRRELLFAFIAEIKKEFEDENWDYLEFIAERVLINNQR